MDDGFQLKRKCSGVVERTPLVMILAVLNLTFFYKQHDMFNNFNHNGIIGIGFIPQVPFLRESTIRRPFLMSFVKPPL